jgi:hypothetical protein
MSDKTPLVENVDYYMENGRLVFTSAYHRKRGHCCNSKCRHCPYGLGSGMPEPDCVIKPVITISMGSPRKPGSR